MAQVTKYDLYYHGSLFSLLRLCVNIRRGIHKLAESECWACEASMTDYTHQVSIAQTTEYGLY